MGSPGHGVILVTKKNLLCGRFIMILWGIWFYHWCIKKNYGISSKKVPWQGILDAISTVFISDTVWYRMKLNIYLHVNIWHIFSTAGMCSFLFHPVWCTRRWWNSIKRGYFDNNLINCGFHFLDFWNVNCWMWYKYP